MSAFDKVVGYEGVKNELLQICDNIKNREIYDKLGAKLPSGMMLYGDPGLGKTLLAKCFIEESGVKAFIIRKNQGNGRFIEEITETFQKAKDHAPSIILLDDMDKFANEDDNHRDAEEYVAVQAGIDSVKGCGVFVLATVNDKYKLPDSLRRSGRFDSILELERPTEDDARKIVQHYLSNKKLSDDVDMDDLIKMIRYSSCAELESILNNAAISAAYYRKDCVEMQDLIDSVLKKQYNAPKTANKTTDEERERIALHEAGHVVVCEVLLEGSVGLASLRGQDGEVGGFMQRCKKLPRRPQNVLLNLGGKAAVELYYADSVASGTSSDLSEAVRYIRDGIMDTATSGIGCIDIWPNYRPTYSNEYLRSTELVVHIELEKMLLKTREILLKNREFLEKTRDMLLEKETLLASDIKNIRKEINITQVCI